MSQTNYDLLVVGAHPDDVEVGVGGIVANAAKAGKHVAILDLTEGELGSRGSVAERRAEAQAAAQMLGVAHRANAQLPDGGIANSEGMRQKLIAHIRELRPRILLCPMHTDRHPDHDAAHYLVRDANYLAGLSRIDNGQEPHRAVHVYYYRVYGESTPPSALIDISDVFETKLAALRAYKSQLFNPQYEGAATFVSSEAFWNSIRVRAEYWGARIGVKYAEPIYSDAPIALTTLPGL
ncbi:MAG: bacillithiol biosynthesis deacetylase BshB1 [Candidatus Hydrogenedentes bacterium]|nr:bacillithiol biosynthesis deacetylase BshB1 [Candidatus Hydrogenedentota bacterium]